MTIQSKAFKKMFKGLTFLAWDETDSENGSSSTGEPLSTSMPLQGTPELLKSVDDTSIIIGTWQDDLMFQLSYLQFDLNANQLKSQSIFSAPGIICVATLPEGQETRVNAFASSGSQGRGKFFAIQTSGALNIFSNFRSEHEVQKRLAILNLIGPKISCFHFEANDDLVGLRRVGQNAFLFEHEIGRVQFFRHIVPFFWDFECWLGRPGVIFFQFCFQFLHRCLRCSRI